MTQRLSLNTVQRNQSVEGYGDSISPYPFSIHQLQGVMMSEKETEAVQIILRPSRDNSREIELFIGNNDKSRIHRISLRKQTMWMIIIFRNIIKHLRLND